MNLPDAKIIVMDTETTGLDYHDDKVIEVGAYGLLRDEDGYFFERKYNFMLNPGDRQIDVEAMAVHHITDDDVRDAPRAAEEDWSWLRNYGLIAAHNAPFDRNFCEKDGITDSDQKWLCTLRLAKHLFPDAPSHKNQVLRYLLGFYKVPGDAHRASHDAHVTALVLRNMLEDRLPVVRGDITTVDELIDFAESPVLLRGKIGFGKHAKLTWKEVGQLDPGYLRWMRGQGAAGPDNPDGWDRDQWHTVNYILNNGTNY